MNNYGKYSRKLNMLCFDASELKDIYRNDKKNKLKLEINKRKDLIRTWEVVDCVLSSDLKHKEEIEVFVVLNLCAVFFGEKSKICFPIKNSFDIKKTPIKNLDDLKSAIEENNLIDFAILLNDSMRYFQFKQYKGELETEEFLNFIKKCLSKYGNRIGDTNLLIALQGNRSGVQFYSIDFNELNKKMNLLNINNDSQVLVSYNEGNKSDVIIQVYPSITTCKRKIDHNYLAGEFLYS